MLDTDRRDGHEPGERSVFELAKAAAARLWDYPDPEVREHARALYYAALLEEQEGLL